MTKNNQPGRPRSQESYQSIIQATLEILREQGYQRLTIEAVAARAQASKTTIYRHWTSKQELVIEAIGGLSTSLNIPDTNNLYTDLLTLLQEAYQIVTSAQSQALLFPSGGIYLSAEIFPIYHSAVIMPRLHLLIQRIERAINRGEIRTDVEAHIVVDLIAGPLFYHFFMARELFPPTEDLPRKLVDVIWQGIGGSK
jgi:AcrR family transcriptional regulator